MSTNLPPFFDAYRPDLDAVARPVLQEFGVEESPTMTGQPHAYFLLFSRDGRTYSISTARRDFTPEPGRGPYFEALSDQLLDVEVVEARYFQITTDTAFIREGEGKWKLARLIHLGISDPYLPELNLGAFVSSELDKMRGSERDTYTVGRGLAVSSSLRRAIAAAPQDATGVVHLQSWDKEDFFPSFPSEAPARAAERQAGLSDPEGLLELLPHFPELLRFEGARFLPSILCFLSYVKNAGPARLDSIKATLSGIHTNADCLKRYLDLFQLCEWDWSVGDKVLALAPHPKRDFIAFHFKKLLDARDAILMGDVESYRWLFEARAKGALEGEGEDYDLGRMLSRMDKTVFKQVMLKEMVSFVNEAATTPLDERTGAFASTSADAPLRKVQDRFSARLAVWGGLFREATGGAVPFSKEDLETLLIDTEIVELDGGPDYATKFSTRDLEHFARFVCATYAGFDPEYGEFLIRDFPRQLQDPTYHFLLVKFEGELVGLIKWNDDGLIGSQYLDQSFSRKFALGSFLQKQATSALAGGAAPHCTVSIRNTALERQVGLHGVATRLFKEGDLDQGGLVFYVEAADPRYRTKNRAIFSDEAIVAVAEGGRSLSSFGDVEGIEMCCLDSSVEVGDSYTEEVQRHFEAGQVLTRVLYGKDPAGKTDRRKTYMVFEPKLS